MQAIAFRVRWVVWVIKKIQEFRSIFMKYGVRYVTYLPILGYNPASNEFSTIFLFQPKVKSILLFYWNLTTYGDWFEKNSSMKLLNVACNITKEGSPLEAKPEEIFFCLLTMLTQWSEIISCNEKKHKQS